jgi:peptide/nickel transport system permease protein
MGLTQPVPTQVFDFVTNALQGNLGRDFVSQQSVTSLIGSVLPDTIALAFASLGLAVVLGAPLGVYAAVRRGGIAERGIGVLSVSFMAIPPYVGGLVLLLLFPVTLGVLPAVGAGSFSDPLGYAEHLLLPAVALAVTWIGYIARLVRTSMVEVLETNYIRTARAFGLRSRSIAYGYALRNALIPTVAVLGVGLGTLLGGTIYVEVIFSRPGMGSLLYNAILTRNYPVIRGCVLVIAVLFVCANLAADVVNQVLDPRLRAKDATK